MTDQTPLTGYVTQTTPPSTPLDTLKALALRTIDRLDYVTDQLGGGAHEVPEDLLEYIDAIKTMHFAAIAEHVPVARDERLGELRYIHPDGRTYADGTPVVEQWTADYGVTDYYPRYDGPRDEALKHFHEWSREALANAQVYERFENIVRDVDWGPHDQTDDNR
ncbi:hypothetical protein [Leucobacter japonicus]|uniref:hypothetical protein n=1 Tax=Leucobacter japonicus TaxID=1461259 RepID=UPI0006A77BB1|nr:hypothetical protein [Leucobacter japonicus]